MPGCSTVVRPPSQASATIGSNRRRRDRIVIATKFFGNLYPGDPNGGGASRKSLMPACEQSLRRLKTDYIDLYWMHCWDHHTPIDETMRALDDLVRSGKVRYIGFPTRLPGKLSKRRCSRASMAGRRSRPSRSRILWPSARSKAT
jgi:hypothetical protein